MRAVLLILGFYVLSPGVLGKKDLKQSPPSSDLESLATRLESYSKVKLKFPAKSESKSDRNKKVKRQHKGKREKKEIPHKVKKTDKYNRREELDNPIVFAGRGAANIAGDGLFVFRGKGSAEFAGSFSQSQEKSPNEERVEKSAWRESNALKLKRKRLNSKKEALKSVEVKFGSEKKHSRSDNSRPKSEKKVIKSGRGRIKSEKKLLKSEKKPLKSEKKLLKSEKKLLKSEYEQSEKNTARSERKSSKRKYSKRSFVTAKSIREGSQALHNNKRRNRIQSTRRHKKDTQSAPVITGGQEKDSVAAERRDYVKQMMVHAWENYVKYAWGKNELRPVSMSGHSASIFGSASMGATIVDVMDTLYIMGMHKEFKRGREWINSQLDMNKMTGDVSVFETNIRYVGGMLTLYSFTGDTMFKEKAVHIVDKLLPAFNTATGIPYALVNMQTGSSKNFGGYSILSEFGTLHMEFTYLSDVTGNPVYKEKVDQIRNFINKQDRPSKLYPNYLHPNTGIWGQKHTSVGALGDSFYEYLLKEWLRSGKKDEQAKEMFDEAAKDIEDNLVKVSPHGLTYIAEMKNNRLEHKMDHLACFAGGMYGMAAHNEKDSNSDRWMKIAEGITNTCHESYVRSDTKLGPESFRFTESSEAKAVKQNEKHYILRPETFESYFIMWRLTKNQKYRDWGWEAVQAIENSCKVDGGYTGVRDVYQVGGMKDDVQQSFFLAETLKYLYLLFSDDSLIDMDQWVFNTEAHPLPIRGANNFYRSHSDKQS